MEEFAQTVAILEENYYTDEELARWLTSPHPRFEGKTAIQLLAEGRKRDLLASVRQMDDGVYI